VRLKNTGIARNVARSVAIPVEIARSVLGQRNMTTPIGRSFTALAWTRMGYWSSAKLRRTQRDDFAIFLRRAWCGEQMKMKLEQKGLSSRYMFSALRV
jgi:hypothetical protein